MSRRPFFTQLSLLTLFVALILLGLQSWTILQQELLFSWIILIFFFVFSIGMYFLAHRAAHSSSKYAFLNMVLGMTFVKMLLCVVIALIYKFTMPASSKLFLAIFLGIYVVYTIFETYWMMKLSKIKSDHSSSNQ